MKILLTGLGTMILMMVSHSSFSQQLVKFDYDDAGNRIKRYETVLARAAASEDTLTIDEVIVYHETLFPNPTQGPIRFLSDDPEFGTSEVHIVDLQGRTLLIESFESSDFEIDLSRASNGIYLVRWTFKEEVKTYKIIKE